MLSRSLLLNQVQDSSYCITRVRKKDVVSSWRVHRSYLFALLIAGESLLALTDIAGSVTAARDRLGESEKENGRDSSVSSSLQRNWPIVADVELMKSFRSSSEAIRFHLRSRSSNSSWTSPSRSLSTTGEVRALNSMRSNARIITWLRWSVLRYCPYSRCARFGRHRRNLSAFWKSCSSTMSNRFGNDNQTESTEPRISTCSLAESIAFSAPFRFTSKAISSMW